MSNTKRMSKAAVLARVQALINGLQKHFPNGSLTVGSVVYTTASLVQVLQGLADAITAVITAEQNAKAALEALRASMSTVGPIITATRRLVVTMFSASAPVLADFGIAAPTPRPPLSPQERAVRAAKAEATRVARGTKSPKAKRAIKGNVTGVIITPVTAPAAVTLPSPEPASSASSEIAPIQGAPATK